MGNEKFDQNKFNQNQSGQKQQAPGSNKDAGQKYENPSSDRTNRGGQEKIAQPQQQTGRDGKR